MFLSIHTVGIYNGSKSVSSRSTRAQHTSGLFPSIEPSQTSQFFGTSSFNSKSKSIQASNALRYI